jgi:ferredoxin
MDCVSSCPTQAFYDGETMLVINSDECIDCAICVPECPADAILPDTLPGSSQWLQLNAAYAAIWPNITTRGPVPADAADYLGETGKYAKYFSTHPGAARG